MVGLLVAVLLAAGAGLAVASSAPALRASGPTAVSGTSATSVFRLGDSTVRQVRYADRGTLVYSFRLVNEGRLPVRVTGLAPLRVEPRLFRYLRVVDFSGRPEFTVPGGGSRRVRLELRMTGCETLSARAGSFVTEVRLVTRQVAGLGRHVVTVALPEQVRTGSPREAGCANATATSRPPG